MKMSALLGIYVVSAILVVGGPTAYAEEQNGKSFGLTPAVVEQLDIANKLIALGDARKDPLLLIAAARLQKTLGVESTPLPAEHSKIKDVLERARILAMGRKDLIGLIDDIAAMQNKGFREDCKSLRHGPSCADMVIY